MKLPNVTHRKPEKCKLCEKIEIKTGRLEKEQKRIDRWVREMQSGISRGASIEASEAICYQLHKDITDLETAREWNKRNL